MINTDTLAFDVVHIFDVLSAICQEENNTKKKTTCDISQLENQLGNKIIKQLSKIQNFFGRHFV